MHAMLALCLKCECLGECVLFSMIKNQNNTTIIIIRPGKDIFGTCGLKTLFFGTSVSIHITDDTWVLEKNELGTSVYFFVQ